MNLKEEMLYGYREYPRDEERSLATVGKYLRDVKAFMRCLGEDEAKACEVDREKVREYKMLLREQYKISSANSILTAVNSFFIFLGWRELKMRLFKVQRAQYSRPKTEMAEKDYERLVQAARRRGGDRTSMLIQIIGSTGIRISELKLITVESLETGRAEVYNKGKSRVMLLPVELSRLLKQYCGGAGTMTGSISITRQENPVNRSNVSKKMEELGKEADIDMVKIFPHNLEHLFARISYSVEEDVVRLVSLLGHSSINTIGIYTMTTEEQPRGWMPRMKMVLEQQDNSHQIDKKTLHNRYYEVSAITSEGVFPHDTVYYTHFRKDCRVRGGKNCKIRAGIRRVVNLWAQNPMIGPLGAESPVCCAGDVFRNIRYSESPVFLLKKIPKI